MLLIDQKKELISAKSKVVTKKSVWSSTDKMIGKGGHAEVYKGKLSDSQIVAVKRILKEEKNDEDKNGEFLAELGIIAHIDHPNAAKLIGFSADQGLYLVLQYLPYGSLATALHGDVSRLCRFSFTFLI